MDEKEKSNKKEEEPKTPEKNDDERPSSCPPTPGKSIEHLIRATPVRKDPNPRPPSPELKLNDVIDKEWWYGTALLDPLMPVIIPVPDDLFAAIKLIQAAQQALNTPGSSTKAEGVAKSTKAGEEPEKSSKSDNLKQTRNTSYASMFSNSNDGKPPPLLVRLPLKNIPLNAEDLKKKANPNYKDDIWIKKKKMQKKNCIIYTDDEDSNESDNNKEKKHTIAKVEDNKKKDKTEKIKSLKKRLFSSSSSSSSDSENTSESNPKIIMRLKKEPVWNEKKTIEKWTVTKQESVDSDDDKKPKIDHSSRSTLASNKPQGKRQKMLDRVMGEMTGKLERMLKQADKKKTGLFGSSGDESSDEEPLKRKLRSADSKQLKCKQIKKESLDELEGNISMSGQNINLQKITEQIEAKIMRNLIANIGNNIPLTTEMKKVKKEEEKKVIKLERPTTKRSATSKKKSVVTSDEDEDDDDENGKYKKKPKQDNKRPSQKPKGKR